MDAERISPVLVFVVVVLVRIVNVLVRHNDRRFLTAYEEFLWRTTRFFFSDERREESAREHTTHTHGVNDGWGFSSFLNLAEDSRAA